MEQPPLIESTPAPPVLEKKRYHDLDALRACAMLLGIVLHGILAFGEPGWSGYAPQNDIHWDVPAVIGNAAAVVGAEAPEKFSPYNVCFAAIHGFRMPLFFLVSGFFTAMLWRTRGTKELLKHRVKRILLPLAIFTPIAWITMLGGMGIGAVGAKVLFDEKADNSITDAVIAGDLDAVKGHLNERADINQRNDKGETLLHIAAFFAHPEVMQFLLDKGVDPTIKSKKGETALNYVEGPWNKEIEGIYKYIGGLVRLESIYARNISSAPKECQRNSTPRPTDFRSATQSFWMARSWVDDMSSRNRSSGMSWKRHRHIIQGFKDPLVFPASHQKGGAYGQHLRQGNHHGVVVVAVVTGGDQTDGGVPTHHEGPAWE